MLNPDASLHADRLGRPPHFPEIFEEHDNHCQSPTLVNSRRKKLRSTSTPASYPTCWHAPRSPLTPPYRLRSWQPSDASLLKQNKKRISRSLIIIGSGNSGSGHTTSSSTKSRTTSPPPRAHSPVFGSPLRRSAGLAKEEEEYRAVHGHWLEDADECVELERATRKGRRIAR